jgi:hypothetical protein
VRAQYSPPCDWRESPFSSHNTGNRESELQMCTALSVAEPNSPGPEKLVREIRGGGGVCWHPSSTTPSNASIVVNHIKKNNKAIPVAGHEGLQGSETSRLPHFLDNRLIDGGEVVSLTRLPPFTPRKIPSTHFC